VVQAKANDFAVVVELIAACAEHAASWPAARASGRRRSRSPRPPPMTSAGGRARSPGWRRGLHNADIAARPFVSVRTVESHVQNADGKLGVYKREELANVLSVE
jgi:anti-sigma factor RsiW